MTGKAIPKHQRPIRDSLGADSLQTTARCKGGCLYSSVSLTNTLPPALNTGEKASKLTLEQRGLAELDWNSLESVPHSTGRAVDT
jgi:hypothetical protein